jgi:hypothetical protein
MRSLNEFTRYSQNFRVLGGHAMTLVDDDSQKVKSFEW